MKYALTLLIIFTIGFIGKSQVQVETIDEILTNSYPEGVYMSFKSFQEKNPNTRKLVEARDIFKTKKQVSDPLIDNCYFYYKRTNKRVKDAFAISYRGSLYFHIKSLQEMMEKKDSKQKMDHKDSFIRVIGQGAFLYMEGYVKKGGGIGFGIGAGPVSIGTGGPREELRGIVYDIENEQFDLFRDCKDFIYFLEYSRPDLVFKCDKKAIPIEIVRDVMFVINQGK